MMSNAETAEFREVFYQEMAELERMAAHHGSFTHICRVLGGPVLTHHPVGQVLRRL